MRKAVSRARRETKKGVRRLHPPIGGHLQSTQCGYEPSSTAVALLSRATTVPMSASVAR